MARAFLPWRVLPAVIEAASGPGYRRDRPSQRHCQPEWPEDQWRSTATRNFRARHAPEKRTLRHQPGERDYPHFSWACSVLTGQHSRCGGHGWEGRGCTGPTAQSPNAPRLFQPSRRSKGTFDPNDLDSSTILKIIHLFVEQIRELMEEECLQDIEVEFRCSLRAETR